MSESNVRLTLHIQRKYRLDVTLEYLAKQSGIPLERLRDYANEEEDLTDDEVETLFMVAESSVDFGVPPVVVIESDDSELKVRWR